jgi:selenocysteine lyase/cysteine desulfurase
MNAKIPLLCYHTQVFPKDFCSSSLQALFSCLVFFYLSFAVICMISSSSLGCEKHLFSLDTDVHYINCAYMSPLLNAVTLAGIEGVMIKQKPYQVTGEHFFQRVEDFRTKCARLLNTRHQERIVLIPSVSYGMGIVAKNLRVQAGQNIIILHDQFPSNVFVWQKFCAEHGLELRVITPPPTFTGRGKIWNEYLLSAIDKNTVLVSMEHIHWTDGTKFNLQEIRQRTRDVGALLAVDGTQSLGAFPLDLSEIDLDVLIAGSYKWMMGPYGLGFAYFSDYFLNGQPLEEGWVSRQGSEDFSTLTQYSQTYKPNMLRYEMGERSSFALVPMFNAALDQLNTWQPHRVQAYCTDLVAPYHEQLCSMGFTVENAEYRAGHLFGIRTPATVNPQKLMEALQKRKIYVSLRSGAIRIAPHVYNEASDMDALMEALRESM